MNDEITTKLAELDTKINHIYESVEKTRKYLLTMLIVSVAVVVLPLIAMIFVVPMVMNTLTSAYSGLL